jgi:hypothetical protein
LSYTVAIQLQARSTASILQALADGDGKGGDKDDKNATAAANVTETECAAEGEFCECENDILFGKETKNHTLNRTKEFSQAPPKDDGNQTGLMCESSSFGGDPLPGVKKNCFCSAAAKKNETHEIDLDFVHEEYEWGQIKLIGNNDNRTVMINTTERNITAAISTHLNLDNIDKKVKRPAGNCRGKRAKFAFVQDNGNQPQRWKKETHPKVSGGFRLIDETNYCLWANAPQDFKRNKASAFVTAIPTQR